jgi:cobalamin 5'-phosphate synthase/cobalamin synthase
LLPLTLAVTFLTRLPLRVTGAVTAHDLRASMAWYPLVGLGLGACGWGLYYAGLWLFPSALLAAALVIIALEAATGALHLDGLMDTCDGLGSGAPRERALEIMKDSRVGAMGVFGAVAVLLIKVVALGALSLQGSFLPLLIGWSAARLVPALDVLLFPYARKTGTGGAFAQGKSPWASLIALVSVVVISGIIGHVVGLALAVGVLTLTLLLQMGISRKLGGLTGDVYGMGIELTETLALVIGSVLVKWTFI